MEGHLTKREREVLALVIKGKNNVEISKLLHISIHTTKVHVSSIISKFHAKNRVSAAVMAVSSGMF